MVETRKRLVVIGHPLAAEENRLAFRGWVSHQVHLILPRVWTARTLGHTYSAPLPSAVPAGGGGEPALHSLATLATGRNSLFFWLGLAPLLKRLKPDAIYCWAEPWSLSTWQVGRLARGLGVPVVFYTAENRVKRLPWPFPLLLRAAFAGCPACIAPTGEIAARIKAWGFTGKVFEIPLWIRPRRGLRAEATGRCLAYVGRLIPLKRVNLLVESLALLPEFRLRIIGDGPERRGLGVLVKSLGLESRVEFRGHIDNGDLEAGLEGVSLLVMPTAENPRQAEQFGKAALEGVSCGLPVLASRTGNLAALADSFPTLAARDLDSPAQMAEAVTSVFLAFPEQPALSGARLRAEAIYGPAAAARRLETAFSLLTGVPLTGAFSPGDVSAGSESARRGPAPAGLESATP